MLNVTKISVRSFDLDHLDLFWEIAPVQGPASESEPHEIFDYQFLVLRSEAAMGPYTQIGHPLRDAYHFRDNDVPLLHKWRQFYYKIRVLHVPSGELKDFGPAASVQPEQDLIANEIMRQEDVLFREFVGRKCWLFPVRTFGPACSCYDPFMKKKKQSNHLACFGTGWLGGYMSPVEVYVQIDPFPKASQITPLQEMQSNNTAARMIAFPPVNPRDILIEAENRRWEVVQVSNTSRLRAVVHQELQLHEIPKGDIHYALPVNVNTQTLAPSADRNFTNPQNVENDGKDYSDILAVYGHPRGSLR